jgi:hypothetical protein
MVPGDAGGMRPRTASITDRAVVTFLMLQYVLVAAA